MPAMTTFLQNNLLNHVTQGITYTPPVGLWLGLFTTATDSSGGGTEVSGGAYVRRSIVLSPPAGGTTRNSTDVFFPTATAPWNSLTYLGIFDAVSSGNMLFYGKFNNPSFINTGNTFAVEKDSILLLLK